VTLPVCFPPTGRVPGVTSKDASEPGAWVGGHGSLRLEQVTWFGRQSPSVNRMTWSGIQTLCASNDWVRHTRSSLCTRMAWGRIQSACH
jgi:hypothetical protein